MNKDEIIDVIQQINQLKRTIAYIFSTYTELTKEEINKLELYSLAFILQEILGNMCNNLRKIDNNLYIDTVEVWMDVDDILATTIRICSDNIHQYLYPIREAIKSPKKQDKNGKQHE